MGGNMLNLFRFIGASFACATLLIANTSVAAKGYWVSLSVGADYESNSPSTECTVTYIGEKQIKVTKKVSGKFNHLIKQDAELSETEFAAHYQQAKSVQAVGYQGGPVGPTIDYRAGVGEDKLFIQHISELNEQVNRSQGSDELRRVALKTCVN